MPVKKVKDEPVLDSPTTQPSLPFPPEPLGGGSKLAYTGGGAGIGSFITFLMTQGEVGMYLAVGLLALALILHYLYVTFGK